MNKVTSYLKNLGKSVRYAAVDIAGELVPVVKDFSETNEEVLKSVYAAAAHPTKTIKIGKEAIMESKIYREVRKGLDNVLEDIKTGNWYNKERMNKAVEDSADLMSSAGDDFFKDNGMDDFGDFEEYDWGDDDDSDSDDSPSISTGDLAIADTVSASSNASAQLISTTVANSSANIIKGNVATTNALMSQNISLIAGVRTSIAGVHESINAILDFANQTAPLMNDISTYIEKSTSLMQESNAILKEMLEMQRNTYAKQQEAEESGDQFSKVFSGGSIDLKEYFKAIKKNAIGLDPTGFLSSIKDDQGMLTHMFANPLGSIITGLVKGFMPMETANLIKRFNMSLTNLFPALIAKFNQIKKDDEGGIGSLIAKLFGLRVDNKTTVDVSKYNKGAVPFDGITRKAIIEVIPAYLARIESYMTKSSQRIFNYEEGKWTDYETIKKDRDRNKGRIGKEASEDVTDAFSTYKKQIKSKKALRYADVDRMEKSHEKLQDMLSRGEYVNIPQLIKNGEFDQYYTDFLKAFIDSDAKYQLSGMFGKMFDAKQSLGNRLRQQEISGHSVENYLDNNSKADEHLIRDKKSSVIKGSKINAFNDLDKYGMNVLGYLRNINSILNFMNSYGIITVGGSGGRKNNAGKRFENFKARNDRFKKFNEKFHDIDPYTDLSKLTKEEREQYYLENAINPNEEILKDRQKQSKTEENYNNSYYDKGRTEEEHSSALSLALIETKKKLNASAKDPELDGFGKYLGQAGSKYAKTAEKIQGKNFDEKWKNTKNFDQKWALIMNSVGKIVKSPISLVDNVLESASNSIFDMLFNVELEDDSRTTGQKIKGYFNKMMDQMYYHWAVMTEDFSENIIGPIAKKIGLGDKWKKYRDKFKSSESGQKVTNFGQQLKEQLKSDTKSSLSFVGDSLKLVAEPITTSDVMSDYRKKVAEKQIADIASRDKNVISTFINDTLGTPDRLAYVRGYNKYARFLNPVANKLQPKSFDIKVDEREYNTEGDAEYKKAYNTWISSLSDTQRAYYAKHPDKQEEAWIEVLKNKKLLAKGGVQPDNGKTKITLTSEGEDVIVINHNNKQQTKKNAEKEKALEEEINKRIDNPIYKFWDGGSIVNGKVQYGNPEDHPLAQGNKQYQQMQKMNSLKTNKEHEADQKQKAKLEKQIEDSEAKRKHTIFDTIIEGVTQEVKNLGNAIYELSGKITRKDVVQDVGIDKETQESIEAVEKEAENDKRTLRETVGNILKDMSGNGVNTLSKTLLGGGVGLLFGAPLIGAAAGAGYSLIKNSQTVQEILYGKNVKYDENGNIIEAEKQGLIKKEWYNNFKKYAPDAGKFGIAGGILSLLTPFGPLGGAAIGAGIGLLKNSETMKEMLFGDEDGLFDKNKKAAIKKYFPKAVVGAGAGALATLFLPGFGLVGNAAVGSALGLLSGTEEFKELIFGEEGPDGLRYGGIADTLKEHFVEPLKNFGLNFKDDFFGFMRESIIEPLKDFIEPAAKEIAHVSKKILIGFPKWIVDKLLNNKISARLFTLLNDNFLDPIASLTKKFTSGLWNGIKGVVSSPFRLLGGIGRGLTARQTRRGRNDSMTARERVTFMKDRGIDNYKFADFDNKLMDKENDEEYLADITRMTGMLSLGSKYFKNQEKRTRLELRNILDEYISAKIIGKDSKLRKKIDKHIKNGDFNLAIEELGNIRKSRLTGSNLTLEQQKELTERFGGAVKRYQASVDARQEFETKGKDGLIKDLAIKLGMDEKELSKLPMDRLYNLANKEYSKFGNISKSELLNKPEDLTVGDVAIKNSIDRIYDLLVNSRERKFSSDERTAEIDKLVDNGIKSAEFVRNVEKHKLVDKVNKLKKTSKNINELSEEKKSEILETLYTTPSLLEVVEVAERNDIPCDFDTIKKLSKLSEKELKLLKKRPRLIPLSEKDLKKELSLYRNDYATITDALPFVNRQSKKKSSVLSYAQKQGVDISDSNIYEQLTDGKLSRKHRKQLNERSKYHKKLEELGLLNKQIIFRGKKFNLTSKTIFTTQGKEALALHELDSICREYKLLGNNSRVLEVVGETKPDKKDTAENASIKVVGRAEGGFDKGDENYQVTVTSPYEKVAVIPPEKKYPEQIEENKKIENDIISTLTKKAKSTKDRIKTIFTENGIIKYIRGERDEWKLSNDSQTKETLEKENEEENNQKTMINHLGSLKDNILGIFDRFKEKDEDEEKEPWYKKLFSFDFGKIGTMVKSGLTLAGGIAAIGALKNAWEDEGENGIMHKFAKKIGDVVSPLVGEFTNWFSTTVPDWIENKFLPNLWSGMDFVVGELLPKLAGAIVKALPSIAWNGIKAIGSWFGIGDDKKEQNKTNGNVITIGGTANNDNSDNSTVGFTAVGRDKYPAAAKKYANSSSTNNVEKINTSLGLDNYTNSGSMPNDNSSNNGQLTTASGTSLYKKDESGNLVPISASEDISQMTEVYNENGAKYVLNENGQFERENANEFNSNNDNIFKRAAKSSVKTFVYGNKVINPISSIGKALQKFKLTKGFGKFTEKVGDATTAIANSGYNLRTSLPKATARNANKLTSEAESWMKLAAENTDEVAKIATKPNAVAGANAVDTWMDLLEETGAHADLTDEARAWAGLADNTDDAVKAASKVMTHVDDVADVATDIAKTKGLFNAVRNSKLVTQTTQLIDNIKDLLTRIFHIDDISKVIKKAMKEAGEEVTDVKFAQKVKKMVTKLGKSFKTKIIDKIAESAVGKMLGKLIEFLSLWYVKLFLFVSNFLYGMDTAESILGVEETSLVEELICGLVHAINEIFGGLIPTSTLVDFFLGVAEFFGANLEEIRKRQKEADKLTQKYNESLADGQKQLTTQERLLREKSFTGQVKQYAEKSREYNKKTQKQQQEESRKANKTYTLTSNPLAQTQTLTGVVNTPANTRSTLLSNMGINTTITNTNTTSFLPTSNAMNAGFGTGSGFVSQLDPKYKNQKFNIPGDTQMQTLGDSGCAPAAAANVLNLYHGKGMEDASHAALKYKGVNTGVSPDYFTDYLGQNGINTYPTTDKRQMLQGIASGKPTVLLGMDPSNKARTPYGSSSSHYVVATGMDKRGNVIIQDPESRKPNALYPMKDVINQSHLGMITGRGKKKLSNYNKRLPKSLLFGRGNTDTIHQDLATFSDITAAELNKHIPSGRGFSGKGNLFIKASKASGLDPRYILAHAAQETGWGDSDYAKAGNFFGIGAYNSNPDNALNYGNESMEAGLIEGAKWIRRNYYDAGQKTLYQMIHSSNGHNYAVYDDGSPNIEWMESIASIMDSIGGNGASVYHKANENISSTTTTSSSGTLFDQFLGGLKANILRRFNPELVKFFYGDQNEMTNTAGDNVPVDEDSGVKSKTAQEFYSKYIGKSVDYDGLYGAQCSDLFKQYLHEVVGYEGYAHPRDGAESIADDTRLDPYFNKVSLNNAKYGDWLIWGPGSFPGEYSQYGHVGMYVGRNSNGQVITFGGNQGSTVTNEIPLDPSGITAVLRYKDQDYMNTRNNSLIMAKGSNKIKSNKFFKPLDTKFTGKGTNQLPELNFKSSYGTDSYDTMQLGASTSTSSTNSTIERLLTVILEVLNTIADNSSKLSEIVALLSKSLDVELTSNDISKLKSNNAQIKNKLANALKSQGSRNGMGTTVTHASTESLAAAMYAIAKA